MKKILKSGWIIICSFILLNMSLAWAGNSTTLEEITVTATKTEVDAELVPFTFHSVDREELDKQPKFYMNNVGELIRDLPGVHVGQYYPWGPPWIHLRGTGYFIGRTVYLIDGLPTHSFMSTAINPRDVERMDVLLGPSSALYGPNASGGGINIITRTGKADTGATAEISYGSNNTVRPYAAIGDESGNWSYYFSYSGDYSDGYHMKPVDGMMELFDLGKTQYIRTASLEANEYDQTWLTGKIVWTGDGGAKFSLGTNYTQRYLYGGHPNYILVDDGYQNITTARFETPVGDIAKIKLTAGYHYDDRPMQVTNGISVIGGVPVADSTISYNTDWTRAIIPVDFQTDFYLGQDNILTMGLFYSREEEKTRHTWWADKSEKYHSELNTTQKAAYIQDHWMLMDNRLSLLAGMRYDSWKYHDIYDSGSTDTTPDDITKSYTTVRGGAKYRFNEQIALRSSVGTAFWPGLAKWFFANVTTGPNQREANPGLQPEKTIMGDIGVDMFIPKWATVLGVTGYYGEISDMVSYSYDENPAVVGGSIVRTRNLGTAEIYGLEMSLKQPITDNLSFTGALTMNRSRIKDDPANDGNQLRNAPDYWGSLGLTYLNPDLFSWEALFRFSDDRYYDDSNTDLPYFHMKSYQTLDMKIWKDWKIGKGLTLTTAVSGVNLFDQDYATEICYVNPGRYFEGTLSINKQF